MVCPDENTVAALMEGRLPTERIAELDAHVDECEECRRLLSFAGGAFAGDRTQNGPATPPPIDLRALEGAFLSEGDLVAGRYRLERCIGKGGMGLVYSGKHETLGHRVAVKVLLPELAASRQAVSRFLNEARAAARIENEHVARVVDVGTLEGGAPFLVMEFLEGADLARVLAERAEPFEVEQAIDHVLEALEGVAHAHALGIVHRDLKPANLFWVKQKDGTRHIKVLDFGISKAHDPLGKDASAGGLTSENALLGSPRYMAPEQLRSSKNVDARADVWAIGVVLHQLLSKEFPFEGETVGDLLFAIVEQEPKTLRDRGLDVPRAIDDVIRRCLRRNADERFSDLSALAHELAPFGSANAKASAERIAHTLGKEAPRSKPKAPRMLVAVGIGVVLVGTLFATLRAKEQPKVVAEITPSALPPAVTAAEPPATVSAVPPTSAVTSAPPASVIPTVAVKRVTPTPAKPDAGVAAPPADSSYNPLEDRRRH